MRSYVMPLVVVFTMCVSPIRSEAKNPFSSAQLNYPSWSAFTDIKLDEPISVEYEGEWYELVSFHGQSIDSIVKSAKRNAGNQYEKRMAEDFVQLIRLMGVEIDQTANVVLRDANGKQHNSVASMTSRNRRVLMQNVEQRGKTLTKLQFAWELDSLKRHFATQFAYFAANNVDFDSKVRESVQRVPDEVGYEVLADELVRLMAHFIDGHASVGVSRGSHERLPFLIEPAVDRTAKPRFVAFKEDRSQFLDPEYPFIAKIEGNAVQAWLDALDEYVMKGSPQYRVRQQLRLIRDLGTSRDAMGDRLPRDVDKDNVRIELMNHEGDKKTVTIPIANRNKVYGLWPRATESKRLAEHNLGYLRIPAMDHEALDAIRSWMPKFKDTDGLIVDVRGNGGGSRAALLELAPHLMTKGDAPRIANVCKFVLCPTFKRDHLSGSRFVYRVDSKMFDDRDRQAINQFRDSFQPEWSPPEDKFSEWHYLVLSKPSDAEQFDYRNPVVILMDEKCFSATDIFLGAFKGWPNVTLIGQPSGGGSARRQSFRLPHSGVEVSCASMASFQPDGQLYDTHGVQPDVVVPRPPEYFLESGSDVILEKAIEHLQTRK